MKQYTTPDQTAKLIELGFEKPNGLEFLVREKDNPDNAQIIQRMAYSIGELIEMLPKSASQRLRYVATKRAWIVDVDVLGKSGVGKCYRGIYHPRLIDALYEMIVKLKKEGVI